MYKKTINCVSCEVKSDIIIRQSNFETEEMEVQFCPMCSAEILDIELSYHNDEWEDDE